MAAKNKVTVSMNPTNHPLSSAQRRAAQIAAISTKQAELKREAAERAARRALSTSAPAASVPRKSATARRSNAR
jgi:hypothetical protein